jgi:hypothetical protein
MRYIFDKESGYLKHKDDTNTFTFTTDVISIGDVIMYKKFSKIVDSNITDAKSLQDLKDKNKLAKDSRLAELLELDKDVPRIIEDIIEFINYEPHQSKKDIINRKRVLRLELNTFVEE